MSNGIGPTSPAAAIQLLQLVVDTLPQFIFWKNRDSVYLGCNDNFAKVAGLTTPAEVVGLSDYDLPWKPDECEYFRSIDQRVMNSGKAEYRIVEPQMQSDGKEAWLETNKIPLFGDNGEVVGILGTFEDVTERKLAEEAAQHAKRLESIGKLAGGVAHDFNNLLGGIIGAAEVLQRRIGGKADQALLGEILRTSERAAELTGKLLAFSRRGNVLSDVLDVHEAVDNVAPLLRRGLDPRIAVEFALEAARPYISGDASELELALLNLSLNARDAMPDGGRLLISTKNVEYSPEDCLVSPFDLKPGTYVRMQVEDSGSGIPTKVIDHVFEPFYTTKAPGAGTGLGLSAVYGAVQAHGGAIEVERDRSIGACFTIDLPISKSQPRVLSDRQSEHPPAHRGLALVADDEPLLRAMTCERLKRMGYETISAEDGERGLLLFQEHAADVTLLVLDVIMPIMSGLECLQRIRETHPKLPVVVSSGFTQEQLIGRESEIENVVFIKKPYGFQQFERAVSEAITRASGAPSPASHAPPTPR